MKFAKGMIIGTAIAAGITLMCSEGMINKKRIMRKAKMIAKKMGMW